MSRSRSVLYARAKRLKLLGLVTGAALLVAMAADAPPAGRSWLPLLPAIVALTAFALLLVTARSSAVASGGEHAGDARRYAVGLTPPEAERSGDRGAARAKEPAKPPGAPRPPRREASDHALALARLRLHMDDVSYTPGSPNVLSMTKYLRDEDAEAAPAASSPDARRETAASVRRRDDADETVIAIRGILDVVTVAEVRPTFEAVVAERRREVTLDLSALRLIDSSGVGLVVSLHKRSRAFGGVVRITGIEGQPLAVFRLLRLDHVFGVPQGT